MKHIKKIDEDNKLKIVNFSDMDGTWDPKQFKDKEKLTGTKDIDLALGQKVKDFLEQNKLFPTVGPGDYCKKHGILLPDEKNLKEYRVDLGTKQSFEDWMEWEGHEEATPELEDEYENIELDYQGDLTWSVFLPVGTSQYELAALSESFKYLKMLRNSYAGVIKSNLDYHDALREDNKGFKLFLNANNVVITNDNVETVEEINYRLYKDSKVFGYFKEYLDDSERKLESMIVEFLKIA